MKKSSIITDADDDSVFEGNNLGSTASTTSSDAEEVGPPDPVPEVEKVSIDLRPLPRIAIGTPAHDTGTIYFYFIYFFYYLYSVLFTNKRALMRYSIVKSITKSYYSESKNIYE